MRDKTWFTIDGTLEPIDFSGPSSFRFPLELAEFVVNRFSNPGDWVLDPFCGFGTTLVAAQNLGRQAIGFEKDPQRGVFAAKRVLPPSRVFIEDSRVYPRTRPVVFRSCFHESALFESSRWEKRAIRAGVRNRPCQNL